MEGKYTGTRYIHSEAEIQAIVWYEETKTIMYKLEESISTGNSEKRYFIKLNNFQINLYKSLPKFEKYDTINERKKLKIFSDFYLPIELGIDEYQEINKVEKQYTQEELKNMLVKELETELSAKVEEPSNKINKQINVKEKEDGIEVQLIYEVLENIGEEKKIDAELNTSEKEN